jgi:hypothetical protein
VGARGYVPASGVGRTVIHALAPACPQIAYSDRIRLVGNQKDRHTLAGLDQATRYASSVFAEDDESAI